MTAAPSSESSSEQGFGAYSAAIRSQKLLVAGVTLVTLLAALVWSQARADTYEATAQLLVTPLDQSDESFLGFEMLRDSGDPTRTVETAATLVYSPTVAEQVAAGLGGDWTREEILDAVAVEPEGQSNILAVTGTAGGPQEATRLANEFSGAALAERERVLTEQVEEEVDQLRNRLARVPAADSETRRALSDRITQLNSIRNTGDPTLSMSQAATLPEGPEGVGTPLLLAVALVVGLVLGGGAALLVAMLNPSIRDEDELAAAWPLPVLARVPIVPGPDFGRALAAQMMPPALREAFRTMLAQLDSEQRPPRTLMITSPSTGDGKTTTAVGLAVSIAAAGRSVVLADLDLRKPSVAMQFGIEGDYPQPTPDDFATGKQPLSELLVRVPNLPRLRLLTPRGLSGDMAVLDALNRRLPDIMASASDLADIVILDTPPIGEISDALTIAHHVEAIAIVARPGNTERRSLDIARDLLTRLGHQPTGYVLVGASAGARSHYYAYGASSGRQRHGPRPLDRDPAAS